MFLSKIKKRDGRIADFDPGKIEDAIHKAFLAVELGDGVKAASITAQVVERLGRNSRRSLRQLKMFKTWLLKC
jgi:anaerobic ribonucleoside-triphosphate reductase